jgi:hypothetical protein
MKPSRFIIDLARAEAQVRDQQRHVLQMVPSDLKSLEDENAKLKKLLAEAMLDNAMLKEIATKNGNARLHARGRRSLARCVRGQRAARGSGTGNKIGRRCAIAAAVRTTETSA